MSDPTNPHPAFGPGTGPGARPDPARSAENAAETLAILMTNNILAAEVEEMDRPHLVITIDPSNGHRSYSGPYPSGLHALLAVEQERADQNGSLCDGEPAWQFEIAPLYEPHPAMSAMEPLNG